MPGYGLILHIFVLVLQGQLGAGARGKRRVRWLISPRAAVHPGAGCCTPRSGFIEQKLKNILHIARRGQNKLRRHTNDKTGVLTRTVRCTEENMADQPRLMSGSPMLTGYLTLSPCPLLRHSGWLQLKKEDHERSMMGGAYSKRWAVLRGAVLFLFSDAKERDADIKVFLSITI